MHTIICLLGTWGLPWSLKPLPSLPWGSPAMIQDPISAPRPSACPHLSYVASAALSLALSLAWTLDLLHLLPSLWLRDPVTSPSSAPMGWCPFRGALQVLAHPQLPAHPTVTSSPPPAAPRHRLFEGCCVLDPLQAHLVQTHFCLICPPCKDGVWRVDLPRGWWKSWGSFRPIVAGSNTNLSAAAEKPCSFPVSPFLSPATHMDLDQCWDCSRVVTTLW